MLAQPLIPIPGPAYRQDPTRDPVTTPGQIIYSAQIARDKVECLYCCAICVKQRAAARYNIDVYSNGVLYNEPVTCCCCCLKDSNGFSYFDHAVFNSGAAQVTGCCKPFPNWCPHCFNLCGESIFLPLPCCVGPGCQPPGWGYLPGCCCMNYAVLGGLRDGEGMNLATQINNAKALFVANGNKGQHALMPGSGPSASPYGAPAPGGKML